MDGLGSTPFHEAQLLHFHLPSSSRVLTPGGANPLTNRHFVHINANRLSGLVSSSPNKALTRRSYHCGSCEDPLGAYCIGASNALGANSAISAIGGDPGCIGAGDPGLDGLGPFPCCIGDGVWPCISAGPIETCRLGIFAVGGGSMRVRPPGDGLSWTLGPVSFAPCFGFSAAGFFAPYLSNSC